MMISLGDAIQLTLEIYDGREDLHPIAHVYNSEYAEVSGSPFSLSHIANGFYKNNSFTPLVEGIYHAVYLVYQDSCHENSLNRYSRTSESFEVNSLLSNSSQLNDKIGTPANGTIANDLIEINNNIDSDEGRAI